MKPATANGDNKTINYETSKKTESNGVLWLKKERQIKQVTISRL